MYTWTCTISRLPSHTPTDFFEQPDQFNYEFYSTTVEIGGSLTTSEWDSGYPTCCQQISIDESVVVDGDFTMNTAYGSFNVSGPLAIAGDIDMGYHYSNFQVLSHMEVGGSIDAYNTGNTGFLVDDDLHVSGNLTFNEGSLQVNGLMFAEEDGNCSEFQPLPKT